jgi:quercetin dioxygenase-like cupin family protein
MPTQPSGSRVLLRGEQTDTAVSVIRSAVPLGATGPRLHQHDFDETFYVIEGALTVQLDDQLYHVGAGELAFAPRGVPHTLTNRGDDTARYLIICTPAGFERYFARRAAARCGIDPPQWALQPSPEVTTIGPPIDPACRHDTRPIADAQHP